MIKVLLVDDEPIIVRGLKKLISWDSLDCEIIGEAYDGEEALEFIRENKPDIVITDLLMPVMDGMELVKNVYEDGLSAKIIILSGHGEFELARNALKYGVFEYLLKPVTKEQLAETISKILGKIKIDIIHSEKMEKMKAQWHENLPLLRDKLVLDVIRGEIHDRELVYKKAELLDMEFRAAGYNVLAIQLINHNIGDDVKTSEEKILVKFVVENIASEVIDRRLAGYTTVAGDTLYILTFIRDQGFSNSILFAVADEIRNCVLEYTNTSVSIGIGRFYSDIADVEKSFEEATQALKSRFLFDNTNIIHINNILPKNGKGSHYPEAAEKEALDVLTYGAEFNASELAVRLVGAFLENSGKNPEMVINFSNEFLIQLERSLRSMGCNVEMHQSELRNECERINRMESLQELQKWFAGKLENARMSVLNMRKAREYDAIREAKNYIDSKYSEDLTLNRVAGKVYMSPTYFSSIFKSRTGVNFCDYLSKVRMDNAARLLKDSGYKTYEVSEVVGYKNPRYFSDAFKRYFGLTPTEFREKHCLKQI